MCLLRHAFQMRKNTILDPLLVVRLVRAVPVVHQAAQVAELVDEPVQLRDVVGDIPHACADARRASADTRVQAPLRARPPERAGLGPPQARCSRAGARRLTGVHLL